MLGKELRNAHNHTWLNYALPASQIAASVEQIIAGKPRPADRPDTPPPAGGGASLAALGLVLVPDILERTPPFVDEVRPGSPADLARLRADDLVVFVGERLVQSCKQLAEELARLDSDSEIKLVVMRGQELIEASLKPGAVPEPTKDQP